MMRAPHPLAALAALAGLLAALAGCSWSGPPPADRLLIRPMPGDPDVAARHLYRLQVFYLVEQLAEADPPSDFWRFLDETVLPPADRHLLARNGLRIAVGGDLAIERLNSALPRTRGMKVTALPPIYARQGYALDVPLAGPEGDLTVLYARSDGSLAGRDFPRATAFLRLAPRAAVAPNTTDIVVSQRIVYGNPQAKYRQTPTGMILTEERPRFVFKDLEAAAAVRDGQIIAVGLEPGRPMTVGERLLVTRDDAARYVTTVILLPELVAPAAVPAGARVVGAPPSEPPAPGMPVPEADD